MNGVFIAEYMSDVGTPNMRLIVRHLCLTHFTRAINSIFSIMWAIAAIPIYDTIYIL
jgi:hypothetical protein